MDFDRLNKWLTLGANLGVLLGILLLVVEVRENQEIMEFDQKLSILDSESLEVARFTQLRMLIIQDAEVARIQRDGRAGKELSPIDKDRFNAMCSSGLWADTLMYGRSVALGRSEFARGTVDGVKRQINNNPGIAECWQNHRQGLVERWGYSEFVNAVESQ